MSETLLDNLELNFDHMADKNLYLMVAHHQITYEKFNLNVIYPPPYEREVWITN